MKNVVYKVIFSESGVHDVRPSYIITEKTQKVHSRQRNSRIPAYARSPSLPKGPSQGTIFSSILFAK